MEEITDNKEYFECLECGLHYRDAATAQKCAAWCLKYTSCNLAIAALSVERFTKS